MLVMMEGQLQRLSGLLRSRKDEIKALQAAVMSGTDERKLLHQEVQVLRQQQEDLQQRLAQQAQHAAGKLTSVTSAEKGGKKGCSSNKQHQAAASANATIMWGAAGTGGRNRTSSKS